MSEDDAGPLLDTIEELEDDALPDAGLDEPDTHPFDDLDTDEVAYLKAEITTDSLQLFLKDIGTGEPIYLVIQVGLSLLLSALAPQEQGLEFEPQPWWWLSLILMLLIVPIQCTAEEVVFRGYLAQMLGRWLRHPLFAILLPKLGMVVSLWILIFVSAFASHEFSFKETALSAIVLSILGWAVFAKGLELQMAVWPKFLTQ